MSLWNRARPSQGTFTKHNSNLKRTIVKKRTEHEAIMIHHFNFARSVENYLENNLSTHLQYSPDLISSNLRLFNYDAKRSHWKTHHIRTRHQKLDWIIFSLKEWTVLSTNTNYVFIHFVTEMRLRNNEKPKSDSCTPYAILLIHTYHGESVHNVHH